MARLGEAEPHPERWPDLAGFIASRQQQGQRVLLWHNVWEWESAGGDRWDDGPDLVQRNGELALGAFGSVVIDPSGPRTERHLRHVMHRLLARPPHGLGADGLKLDITHSTPSGSGHVLQGNLWGNALLHHLLARIYELAKEVEPTAMIECHAANPLFLDTADVLRLNDLHTDLASVAEMMRFRSRVARTAGFEQLDCDGWPMPSRAALREYTRTQPELGIPALYYATRVDRGGELLQPEDYREIARAWRRATS
jgi:hypothetical protein